MNLVDRYTALFERVKKESSFEDRDQYRIYPGIRSSFIAMVGHHRQRVQESTISDRDNRIRCLNSAWEYIPHCYRLSETRNSDSFVYTDPLFKTLNKAVSSYFALFNEAKEQKQFRYALNSLSRPMAKRHRMYFRAGLEIAVRRLEERKMGEEEYKQVSSDFSGWVFGVYVKSKDIVEKAERQRYLLIARVEAGEELNEIEQIQLLLLGGGPLSKREAMLRLTRR